METALEISAKEKFLLNFKNSEASSNELVNQLKKNAASSLALLDFPTTKDEYWKYTRVAKIINQEFSLEPKIEIKLHSIDHYSSDSYKVVLVNGKLQSEKSELPPGIKFVSFSDTENSELSLLGSIANHDKEIFTAINTAYFSDGYLVKVDDNIVLDKPVNIIHIITEKAVALPRLLIHCGKHSKLQIIQEYVSQNVTSALNNVVTETFLEDGAVLDIVKIQSEKNAFHISNDCVSSKANATFNHTVVTADASWVRNNSNLYINGSNAEMNLMGLYIGKEKSHIDNHTLIEHCQPHSNSNELYKGILDDNSTGVFNGRVLVDKEAQKTNAFQANNNILLSKEAAVRSKPELEIYADDVKCSHGSTTGQMDEEAVFYLRARGIKEANAVKLMLKAFVADTLSKIKDEELKDYIQDCILEPSLF